MNVKYIIELNDDERHELHEMIRVGTHSARKLRRARTLLLADDGKQTSEIAEALCTNTSNVYRTKRRFVEGGLEHALTENRRPGACRKLDGTEEALLIATACTDPPEGQAKWTMQLLANEVVALTDHDSISPRTIGRRLKENELKPWQKRMWCIPDIDAEYVARMEDVLSLYAEEGDPTRPVVSFDESPTQLIGEVRTPIMAKPGKTARIDYEYKRNGTANLFVMLDCHQGRRHVKVTPRRTACDFAECMRDLVDVHYPEAEVIRVVLDNLNIHTLASLYRAFTPVEARRIASRLEFHYTPKHASWLNMVEIEIGVLSRQCLDRRIPNIETLVKEVAAWQKPRNNARTRIEWMFDVQAAREKLAKAYPVIDQHDQASDTLDDQEAKQAA